MAKEEKPQEIKDIEEFEKRYDTANRLANAMSLSHAEAYLKAVKKHLGTDSPDEIDYDKLDNPEMHTKFADTMSEFYVEKAKDYFKVKGDSSSGLKDEQLMNSYAGVTKDEILKNIRLHGKRYTIDKHNEKKNDYVGKVQQTLLQSASSKLSDKHISHMLKHMDLDDIIDKDKINREETLRLHFQYLANDKNALTKKQIEEQYKHSYEKHPIYFK